MTLVSVLLLIAALGVLVVSDHQPYWPGASRGRNAALALVVSGTLIVLALALCGVARAAAPGHAQVPRAAKAWRPTLTREARAVWGLAAPVSLFAAQIQQESAWRADARSPYAEGLAQFTQATAHDMARWYPTLGPADAYNPRWAIRALVRYDHRLHARIDHTASDCDHWAMVLSSYNGGRGWLIRDRALCRQAHGCNPTRWWGNVALHTHRADWAKRENRAYPKRILRRWQPVYVAAGWPGQEVCP